MRDAFFAAVISLALVIPSRCQGYGQSSQTDTNLINYSAGVKDYGVITGEASPSEQQPLPVATSSETPVESPRYWWQNVDSPFIKDAQPSLISLSSSTLPPIAPVELNIVSDSGTTGLRIPSPDHRLTQALFPNNPFLNGEVEQKTKQYTIAPTAFTTSGTTPGGPRDYPQAVNEPLSSNSIAPSGYPSSGYPQTGDHTNGYSPSTENTFPTAAPTPYPGCAAALKCVPETYCNQQGFASDTPVELTQEFIYNRVPLTDCLDEPTGIIGKCCRDPNYKDPWPADLPHEHGHEHGHEHSHEHEHEHEHTDSNSVHPDEAVKPTPGLQVIPISTYQPSTDNPNPAGDYGGPPVGGYKPPPPPPPPPSPSPPYGQPQPPTSPPHQPHPSHPSHPIFIPPYKPSFPPHSSSHRPPPQHPFHPPFTPGGGSQTHPGSGSQITYPGSGSQPHPGPGSQITYPGSGSQPHPGPGPQITYPGSGSQPHPGPGSQITYPGSGSQPHPGSGYPGSQPGPSPTFPPHPPSQPPPYGSSKPPLSIIPPQQPSHPTVPVSPPPTVYPGSPGESSPSYPAPSRPGYPSHSPPEYPSKPPHPEQPPTQYPQHPQEPSHYPQHPPPQYPSQPPTQYPQQPPPQYPSQPPPQYPSQPPPQYPSQPPSQYPSHPPPQYPSQPPTQYPQHPPPQYPSHPPPQRPQHPPPQYPQQPPTQYPQQPPTQYPQRPPPQYPSQPPPQYPSQPPTQYPQHPPPQHPSQPPPQYPSQPPTQYPQHPPPQYPQQPQQPIRPPAQYPYPEQPSTPEGEPYAEKHSAGPEVVEVTQPPFKYHILNKFEGGSCGTKKNDGTAQGNAPWHVIVYSSKNKDLICAGAIVSDNAILTAAHCLDHSEAESTEVKIGPQGKMYKVAAIARHSQYEPISFNRDLALVFLHEPIPSDEYVEKICLPTTAVSPSHAKDCYASSMDKDFEQSTLEVVPVEVFPYKDCEIKLRNTYLGKYFILNDSFSCVSTPAEKELCNVKTGSPIACSRGDGSYELFGIKSWDLGCQQYKSSAIFSNADVLWIQNTLQTPLSKLSENEKARRKDKFKGESLEGVNINEKPGFGQGYGK